MKLQHNAPITERLKYDRENISPTEWEDIAEDLRLLEQLREAMYYEDKKERKRLLREIAR